MKYSEVWGKTYIDFDCNFSETKPKRYAAAYAYFSGKPNGISRSIDGILFMVSKEASLSRIKDLAKLVNKYDKTDKKSPAVNFSVLSDAVSILEKNPNLINKYFEIYRKHY